MRKNRSKALTLAGILLITNVVLVTVLISSHASSEGDASVGRAVPKGATAELPALTGGAVLSANRWPDACSLVSREEIEAIFPGAKDITEERRRIYTPSIKEFGADSSWRESDRSEAGQCLYSMRLPGEKNPATQFWLRIEAVADPELIARYYERFASGGDPRKGAMGADRCVVAGTAEGSWICHKGPLLFTVGGQTTVAFDGEEAPAPWTWRDNVLPEFVRTIASKIK
ncbi:hypothetical protein [Streptomyces sp. NPDC058280]|uniref:hypothetical protein n=1 Tax=Streptomyces sp. NPDC058280 TaxID=3346419 RepID=UPI0036E3C189